MTFRKVGLSAGAVALAAFGWTATAQAGQFTPVDVLDGSGTSIATDVQEFDWSSTGRGVAIDIGPFGTPLTVGQTFDFKYQSYLNGFVGAPSTLPGLQRDGEGGGTGGALTGNDYEFTVVASFSEVVTSFSVDPVTNEQSANFELGPGGGTISIYYDDAGTGGSRADNDAGTGFDNGTEIARFTIVAIDSEFETTEDVSEGNGRAEVQGKIAAALDFADPNFIVGQLGEIFDLELDGTLEFPPLSFPDGFHIGGDAAYPDFVPGDNDITFQVDSNSTFSIPEPQTLLLFGIGLLMVGFVARRRGVITR